jgi:hypothetical protein
VAIRLLPGAAGPADCFDRLAIRRERRGTCKEEIISRLLLTLTPCSEAAAFWKSSRRQNTSASMTLASASSGCKATAFSSGIMSGYSRVEFASVGKVSILEEPIGSPCGSPVHYAQGASNQTARP